MGNWLSPAYICKTEIKEGSSHGISEQFCIWRRSFTVLMIYSYSISLTISLVSNVMQTITTPSRRLSPDDITSVRVTTCYRCNLQQVELDMCMRQTAHVCIPGVIIDIDFPWFEKLHKPCLVDLGWPWNDPNVVLHQLESIPTKFHLNPTKLGKSHILCKFDLWWPRDDRHVFQDHL